MFAIEKGVEIPKAKAFRQAKYPYQSMEVGDSFFVPSDEKGTPIARMRSSSAAYSKRTGNVKFVVRIVDGGVRVWRTV